MQSIMKWPFAQPITARTHLIWYAQCQSGRVTAISIVNTFAYFGGIYSIRFSSIVTVVSSSNTPVPPVLKESPRVLVKETVKETRRRKPKCKRKHCPMYLSPWSNIDTSKGYFLLKQYCRTLFHISPLLMQSHGLFCMSGFQDKSLSVQSKNFH